MRRLVSLLVLAGLALGASRCALVSGLSDLDVAVEGGVTVDGGATDAPRDVSEASPPLDAGCTCVSLPVGWTAVRFRADKTATCPNGDVTEDVLLAPAVTTASGACGCSCTNTTDCANPSATYRGGVLCGGGTKGTVPLVTSGTCSPSPGNYQGTDSFDIAPKSGSCTAQAAPFASASTGSGRLCTIASSPCAIGAGCNDPAGGFAACVVKAGDATCPVDYPKRTLVATSLNDTRTCSGCSCDASPLKCQYAYSTYATNQCVTQLGTATALAGGCANVTVEAFYKATATVMGTCIAGNGVASGTATAVGGRTTCCK